MSGRLGTTTHTADRTQHAGVLGGTQLPNVQPCPRQRRRRCLPAQAVAASPMNQKTEDIRETASRMGEPHAHGRDGMAGPCHDVRVLLQEFI